VQLRQKDFPCDTLWFDIDYMDHFHHFTWNPTNFPDPVGMHQRLDKMGFHRVYISEPLLLATDPLWPFLDAKGYFLKRPTGETHVDSIWFGDVSFIDFTKSDTRAWYKEQLITFIASGISGLWIDLNEPANNFMPEATYNFDGDPRLDIEARNIYALYHAQVAYEGQRELRTNTRPWNFSRSGYSGIQRYAHTWSGDPPSTFDSLRVAIQISISMGLSGQNQFGHDTGGFLGSPDAELFTRWLEFSGFSPLFRNHSVNTALPREPWVFGEPYTTIIRDVIRRRYQFLPYIYTLMEEASRTGRPVLAPTFFYARGDAATYGQDYDYLYGPNLLVAPVFTEGATNRSVYLPAGSGWTHFWSGQRYAGGQTVTVSAPIGRIPAFVRDGGIIVRGGVMDYVGAPMDPTLKTDVYPSGESAFTLYEDDGNGFDYQNGAFLRTQISARWATGQKEISVTRVAGDFRPASRSWVFSVHGVTNAPAGVTLNGSILQQLTGEAALDATAEGWLYDDESQVLGLRFHDGSGALLEQIVEQPTILTQPASQIAGVGGTARFVVQAEGAGPFSYLWRLNATNLLTAQTNSMLVLTNVQRSDSGTYTVVVTGSGGSVTSHPAELKLVEINLKVSLDAERQAQLTFATAPGVSYRVQYRDDLSTSSWVDLTQLPADSSNSSSTVADPTPTVSHERYYRVVAESGLQPQL
jgi:alpha-glucosidase